MTLDTPTIVSMPRRLTEHPEGSTEWLIAQLNSADDIDAMISTHMRALAAERDALRKRLDEANAVMREVQEGLTAAELTWESERALIARVNEYLARIDAKPEASHE